MYVYFCDVKDEHVAAQMTDSEIRLEYHLSWATPDEISDFHVIKCGIRRLIRVQDMQWV